MSRRLTALRLVGFKSFAEKTTVEFGAGISAVVGPNGSGKSNLADALRWTLGEQGRMLRTRRSEDVIFAGSSARRAIGMADVTLVIDNSDHLLPVDFGEVEIGRRLYRSGENEYLLNRQKIRLRDLVELLDAGNLSDNAFLFIGQGMVDQALALRPEERRPLFEEAAGVRRHERRRRQAESELAQAESNLERMRDLLAELRPQAKRLAAQAEQLQARRSAGAELAEALLDAARARWGALSGSAIKEAKELERLRAAADGAMAELKDAESEAARLTTEISRRAEAEQALRRALDQQRETLTGLRLDQARLETELAALARDIERVAAEQKAAESRRATALAELSIPVAEADPALATELEYVERQLTELEGGAGGVAGGEGSSADIAARRREVDQHERRLTSLENSLAASRSRTGEVEARRLAAVHELADAERGLETASKEEKAAAEAIVGARTALDEAIAARSDAQARLSQTEADAAAVRGRLAALDAALGALSDEGLARAARARGGALVAEGLEIEPRFRAAVSAALGAAASAFLVDEGAVTALAARRGNLAVSGAAARPTPPATLTQITDMAAAAGGGRLTEAVRRDPQSQVTRLMERVVWLPDMAAALGIRASLPQGWRAVTLAGEVVADDGLVQLAATESVLEQRAQRDAQQKQLQDLETTLDGLRVALKDASDIAAKAGSFVTTAGTRHDAARRQLRSTEETERHAQRRVEQLVRESTWQKSQLERQEDDTTTVRDLVARMTADIAKLETSSGSSSASATAKETAQRAAELRERAAELRRQIAQQAAGVNSVLEARRRAEVTLAMDEARLRDIAAETQRTSLRDAELTERRAHLATKLEIATKADADAAASLEAAYAGGAEERANLTAAETRAATAREALREHETRSRAAEVRALETRLLLDQSREGLLVELAAIGDDGVNALTRAAGVEPLTEPQEADPTQMEDLLARTLERWAADKSMPEGITSGKLSSLRRRFHELGAGNPFAAEEYAELRERLDGMEAQRIDVEAAITSTRDLIASLGALINDQFRATFAALEDAFARRFTELFGGGEAQLSLTAPDDLSTTGIDIHARPPGKKRQPLQMLSGGERALTAVSLLLAMLEVRPVPFCVLDEVDAALDEANVGRFARALRGLAHQTQFIVITHNRGTIENADALYGVTLGDDAVSRVVSMRLPNANGHSNENGKSTKEIAGATETALN
ncbi:MAG TPA: chromosome segregation protein SMC [Candidatus Limnocylindria bacterium]|nr:chromosome segregation protein SMC [Candidatus Limnocylindria bacterium]